MKRLISLLVLMVLAVTVSAQTFQYRSFLGPNLSIQLTNTATTGSTYTYGDSSIWYSNSQGVAVLSLTSYYSTNGFTAAAQANYQTNANVTYGQAWYDVPSFSDRNGNNASITFSVSGTSSARGTNAIVCTLVKLLKKDPGTQELSMPTASMGTANEWTFGTDFAGLSFTNQVSNLITVSTNLPSAFVQGAAGFRVKTITFADNQAAATFTLQSMGIGGYVP